MMENKAFKWILLSSVLLAACSPGKMLSRDANTVMPVNYGYTSDSSATNLSPWKTRFVDPYLAELIDSALVNNQELMIVMQELTVLKNEIGAKKGEYLPFVNGGVLTEVEKVGRYTSQGANDANTEIAPGREFPEPLSNLKVGAIVSWELDVWHKLRNAKQSAVKRYLASMEGRNFMVTHLVAEIADAYYELLALDNQLAIVRRNINIQNNALVIVRHQKEAARVTELAVRRFEAQVLNTRSLQFEIQQQIVETENRINLLVGRYPQQVKRTSTPFMDITPLSVDAGLPFQLLENRPDIRQAEFELDAAKLDVQVAKANFYPSFSLSAGLGLEAFNPTFLVKSPESMLYSLAGDAVGPLINRKAIKAEYSNANSRQVQAVYNYERSILMAFIEVTNNLSMIQNLQQLYDLKTQQVEALTESNEISSELFKSARADYMEVLLTQRDALESKFELIETKKKQMVAYINMYQALGGGWK